MDLLLVRHGVSEHNTSDVISGGTSNPNLSQAGVKQVEEVSKIIDNNKTVENTKMQVDSQLRRLQNE